MANRGAVSQTINAGGSYTIPAGYHNGSGKITASSLSSQTQANATASQILSGRTAWVNGNKVTGNMPSRADSSNVKGDTAWHYNNRIYFATDYGYYPAANYGNFSNVSEKYTSYSSLASVIGLSANKILEGNTILGITGTVENPTNAYNRGARDTGNETLQYIWIILLMYLIIILLNYQELFSIIIIVLHLLSRRMEK